MELYYLCKKEILFASGTVWYSKHFLAVENLVEAQDILSSPFSDILRGKMPLIDLVLLVWLRTTPHSLQGPSGGLDYAHEQRWPVSLFDELRGCYGLSEKESLGLRSLRPFVPEISNARLYLHSAPLKRRKEGDFRKRLQLLWYTRDV